MFGTEEAQWIYWQEDAEVGSGRTGGRTEGNFMDVVKEDVKKDGVTWREMIGCGHPPGENRTVHRKTEVMAAFDTRWLFCLWRGFSVKKS